MTPPADPLLFTDGPWKLKFGLFAGSQFIMEREAFWGLADVFAPTADYDKNRTWTESWFVPTMRLDYEASESLDLYSGLGAAATGNIQRDIFEQGSEWRVSLEQAYGGVRISDKASDVTLDISGGQQPYRYGSGMLIDLGAQNGNQRGAALAAPRKAWEYTGIARLTIGPLSADAFLLNYNEITNDDPDTSLFGGKIEYRLFEKPDDSYVGVAYLNVYGSDMPYIRAPVEIIENGREDTQTINPYLRIRPLRETIPGLYAAVEGAYQWNEYIDLSATAFSAEIGHQWENIKLRPKLSYAYREFSGDDPSTAKLERFDPLFYDGGVHAFASGSNAALAFYNTNVRTHRVALNLTLSQQDILTFSYWRVAALEINSPLQFGQIGRVQTIGGQQVVVAGVPDEHLSDDLYLEYVRMLTPNAFLTLGVGVSFPGDGLDQAAGRSLDPWLGALVNLSFKF
ncbi:MAG: alginate export family protein [Phycisphaerae bacterium]|nr:alginate export family protein [Phycisphaerae bacterium]